MKILVIQQCFEMSTIARLLMIGWRFTGNESLGMSTVKERDSLFYGLKWVPCIVQKQLNHALELKMMELDQKIWKGAKDIMESGERYMWIVGFLALVLLLHIREVYAGRIIYWRRHDLV
jgi:hypothetical protein